MADSDASPSASLADFSVPEGASPLTVKPENRPAGPLPARFFPLGEINDGYTVPEHLLNPAELAKIEPPKSVRTFRDRLGDDLSGAERQKYVQFRDIVTEHGWDKEAGIDEWTTLRFLIARQFDLKKATKMLEAHVKWREEYKPEERVCPGCKEDKNNHMMHFCGWDKLYRPVLYLSYAHAGERQNPDWAVAHNVMTFRQALSEMPEGVEQWVAVTDFVSYSHWRDGRSSVGKVVIDIMQAHYPERLGMQILVDPPTAFWLLWKCLTPFIDAKTKSKVQFMYTTQEPNIHTEFPKIFPPSVAEWLIRSYEKNKEDFAAKQGKK
uniref:CRAL-TRIO domain-containing protein n=2 Tax=Neobodo designis TaxID=312471 RepID=A0A7S1M5F6_NEODS|mmetsp:Transcript_33188/g.102480  ORF Transcript_33188/g.102480 Transcript_33188/m.102480 type:complete len:323 (+) Transcript_33188:35-1003(+)|eukprot:CAMPEP_0174843860 /NCGR_PEP_ID=MMETSP1114-20130205/10783_1 /TAXON_ID=312471 /ORGANISM="Neobodo designis, Strain CCAP 1951/1" /LENGTH=322 /DNA_ID=CAMNT_0016078091 /DNA_START=34 /DNA_END=1002 /DNA_ORIENTATION=-